jgi:hypothetical protein
MDAYLNFIKSDCDSTADVTLLHDADGLLDIATEEPTDDPETSWKAHYDSSTSLEVLSEKAVVQLITAIDRLKEKTGTKELVSVVRGEIVNTEQEDRESSNLDDVSVQITPKDHRRLTQKQLLAQRSLKRLARIIQEPIPRITREPKVWAALVGTSWTWASISRLMFTRNSWDLTEHIDNSWQDDTEISLKFCDNVLDGLTTGRLTLIETGSGFHRGVSSLTSGLLIGLVRCKIARHAGNGSYDDFLNESLYLLNLIPEAKALLNWATEFQHTAVDAEEQRIKNQLTEIDVWTAASRRSFGAIGVAILQELNETERGLPREVMDQRSRFKERIRERIVLFSEFSSKLWKDAPFGSEIAKVRGNALNILRGQKICLDVAEKVKNEIMYYTSDDKAVKHLSRATSIIMSGVDRHFMHNEVGEIDRQLKQVVTTAVSVCMQALQDSNWNLSSPKQFERRI